MESQRYPYHPACLLFPRMNDQELRALADNIKARGLDHDLVLHEGKILDGRNRHLACEIAGVEPTFVEWQGKGSPLEWVVGENLLRRHMSLLPAGRRRPRAPAAAGGGGEGAATSFPRARQKGITGM